MTSAMASSAVQTLPQFSNTRSDSPLLEDKGTISSLNAGAATTTNISSISVDTISISGQPRQPVIDGNKEEAKSVTVAAANTSAKQGSVAASVQFVYDAKGELIVRYMDSSNKLVYQVPSTLALRIKELASKVTSSVDTKV